MGRLFSAHPNDHANDRDKKGDKKHSRNSKKDRQGTDRADAENREEEGETCGPEI